MTTASPVAAARRAPARRAVAARYDGLHALLVRAVHPICFGAFTVAVVSITYVVATVAFALFGDASEIGGWVVVVVLGVASVLASAFMFVLTPARAVAGILVLVGMGAVLHTVDGLAVGYVWGIWCVAAASVVLQLVLLASVLADRWRNGLLHLVVPASVGTLIGALPVLWGLRALLDSDAEQAVLLAELACAAGAAVLVVLLVTHVIGHAGDERVLAEFADHQGLRRRGAAPGEGERMIPRLVPAFAAHAGPWCGTVGNRTVEVVSGFTATAMPDLPSSHLTTMAISMPRAGREVWVRRRSWTHDNVLASLGRSEVVQFESRTLSEEFSVRFAAGTGQLEAFETFGPQVVALLTEELGAAQICRIGSAVHVFIVGGALDASELERMLHVGTRFAELLEQADAADAREGVTVPETALPRLPVPLRWVHELRTFWNS